MLNHRRSTEAAQRAADRRRREDESARLATEVPRLESLRLEIEERRAGGVLTGGTHIRRIVVESAPALFVIPCGDRACKEGGHDITRRVMAALHEGKDSFGGDDTCSGQLGPARCDSILHYKGVATYR
jgi:hypothetical protein